MPSESDKIMFEVYRAAGLNQRYRIVYFTDLEEDQRDEEIDAAVTGDHFFDGFIKAADGEAAKEVLLAFVARLNKGIAGTREELAGLLAPFLTR